MLNVFIGCINKNYPPRQCKLIEKYCSQIRRVCLAYGCDVLFSFNLIKATGKTITNWDYCQEEMAHDTQLIVMFSDSFDIDDKVYSTLTKWQIPIIIINVIKAEVLLLVFNQMSKEVSGTVFKDKKKSVADEFEKILHCAADFWESTEVI